LAVWVSIALADATSGGQVDSPELTVAENATTIRRLIAVARNFLISTILPFELG